MSDFLLGMYLDLLYLIYIKTIFFRISLLNIKGKYIIILYKQKKKNNITYSAYIE